MDRIYDMGTQHTDKSKQCILGILASLRPKQWTKNLVIFAALVFSRTAGNPTYLEKSIAAFAIFCILSGSIYLINDYLDSEQDKKHPLKCKRPIASGAVSRRTALIAAILCAGGSLAGAFALGINFFLVAAAYFILQIAYSFKLKHMVILDVFSIAAGFLLRVVAGAEAISVEISSWLLICTMLLALFLALSKRRHELIFLSAKAIEHRKILSEYSTQLLDQMVSVVTSATVISYSLYTMSEETIRKFHTKRLIFTVPFVLYGIFRYLYLVYRKDEGGSPDTVLLTDKPLITCIFLYGVAVWLILYFLK